MLWSCLVLSRLVQEWGLEGYHLWAVTVDTDSPDPVSTPQVNGDAGGGGSSSSSSSTNGEASSDLCRCEMLQFQFLKSALTVNPCMVSFWDGCRVG